MRVKLYSLFLALVLFTSGCGYSFFAAKTEVTYQMPNGMLISYKSDKEQNNLDAQFDPSTGAWHVKVDKAGGQEAAMAVMMQMYTTLISQLSALIPAAAKTGALAGS